MCSDPCSCGRKNTDHRKSTGIEHALVESQFLTAFWQNRLRDKLLNKVRNSERRRDEAYRDDRHRHDGPEDPADANPQEKGPKEARFCSTDDAEICKEKQKPRKAEGREPQRKANSILDPSVMDDCGEYLGDLDFLSQEEIAGGRCLETQ